MSEVERVPGYWLVYDDQRVFIRERFTFTEDESAQLRVELGLPATRTQKPATGQSEGE